MVKKYVTVAKKVQLMHNQIVNDWLFELLFAQQTENTKPSCINSA